MKSLSRILSILAVSALALISISVQSSTTTHAGHTDTPTINWSHIQCVKGIQTFYAGTVPTVYLPTIQADSTIVVRNCGPVELSVDFGVYDARHADTPQGLNVPGAYQWVIQRSFQRKLDPKTIRELDVKHAYSLCKLQYDAVAFPRVENLSEDYVMPQKLTKDDQDHQYVRLAWSITTGCNGVQRALHFSSTKSVQRRTRN